MGKKTMSGPPSAYTPSESTTTTSPIIPRATMNPTPRMDPPPPYEASTRSPRSSTSSHRRSPYVDSSVDSNSPIVVQPQATQPMSMGRKDNQNDENSGGCCNIDSASGCCNYKSAGGCMNYESAGGCMNYKTDDGCCNYEVYENGGCMNYQTSGGGCMNYRTSKGGCMNY